MEDRIKVIDSHPGSGKTSWAIDRINHYDPDIRIIYITPFLSEVSRIIENCPTKKFVQPDSKSGRGSKLTHLINLVNKGENIASTHALFSNTTDELIEALRLGNYVLFLDEAFQTVEKYDLAEGNLKREVKEEITRQDVQTLLDSGIIGVGEDYSVTWLDESKTLSKYAQIKSLAQRGLLYLVNGSLLLWTFPIEVFREGIFNEIYILTHQFDAQLQAYYYDYFELEYAKYHMVDVGRAYEIIKTIEGEDYEAEWRERIKQRIHILDNDRINRVGDIFFDAKGRPVKTALSDNWYRNNTTQISKVKENLDNFFRNLTKSKAEQRLWTCFKVDQKALKSKGVSVKYWIPMNSRSTNEWGDRSVVAYPINRFLDPFYIQFFLKKGIYVEEDKYALAEMMQFLWRSAIRNGKDIQVYVPSYRMRNLLKNYLNGGITNVS